MDDLLKRLETTAAMIEMGEKIAWGSEVALMREARDHIEAQAAEAKLALFQEYFDAVEAFDEDEGFSMEMLDRVNAARAAIRAMKGGT